MVEATTSYVEQHIGRHVSRRRAAGSTTPSKTASAQARVPASDTITAGTAAFPHWFDDPDLANVKGSDHNDVP